MGIENLIVIDEKINRRAAKSDTKKDGTLTVRGKLNEIARELASKGDLTEIQDIARDLIYDGKFAEIQEIATEQAEKASYIDINVDPEVDEARELTIGLMQSTIIAVQEAVKDKNVQICVDSAESYLLEAGLEACYFDKVSELPILNSVTESNADSILSLRNPERKYQVVLNLFKRKEGVSMVPNDTSEDAYKTAKKLFSKAKGCGFKPEQIYIDPCLDSIAYFEPDKGFDKALEVIEKVHSDREMKECHKVVGISNFTKDVVGKELKLHFQNAFLTLAMEKELDTIIGSTSANYQKLRDDDPIVVGMRDIVKATDYGEKLDMYRTKILDPFLRKKSK